MTKTIEIVGGKMIKKRVLVFLMVFSALCLGTGCKKKSEEGYKEVLTSSGEEIAVGIDNTATADKKDMEVSFLNSCGKDFGMVALFDPVTKESVQLDSLLADEEITANMLWPREVYDFKWAVYDLEVNLIAECTTDLSKAKDTVRIELLGNKNFEDVDVKFE